MKTRTTIVTAMWVGSIVQLATTGGRRNAYICGAWTTTTTSTTTRKLSTQRPSTTRSLLSSSITTQPASDRLPHVGKMVSNVLLLRSSSPSLASSSMLFSTKSGGSGGGGRISNAIQDPDLLSKSDTTTATSAPTSSTTLQPPTPQQQERLSTNPPKGTRDFYPEDMRLRSWLFDQWRSVAKQFAFSEYDAPVLESEALYTRKAGEEVTEQLYNFVDKGNRSVALRPEMTPSLARMVMAKGRNGIPLPIKWFSIPQCWRYERMTRGRRREHYQWNMDIWGVATEEAEVELIAAMVSFFQSVGLTSHDVGIKINSRLVIAEVLQELQIPADKFAATCVLVDKLEKIPIDDIQEDLQALGLDRTVVERLLQVLTNKSLDGLRMTLGPNSTAVQQIERFMSLCIAYNIQEWIVLDASVVRGLAYYTGIVFEAFDRRGELRAIAGGGRYDKLLETLGGDPTPAVGFGFGDAVIVELLKERNLLPSFINTGTDTVVFAMSSAYYATAVQVATALRRAGQSVDVILELDTRKTKWVFKHADRIGATYCAIVGADEYAAGAVSIKRLKATTATNNDDDVGATQQQQETIPIAALDEWVSKQQ